jgi:hypothetical protein
MKATTISITPRIQNHLDNKGNYRRKLKTHVRLSAESADFANTPLSKTHLHDYRIAIK